MYKSSLKETLKISLFVLLFLALIQPFGIDELQERRIAFILGQTTIVALTTFFVFILTINLFKIKEVALLGFRKYLLSALFGFSLETSLLGFLLITFNSWFNTGDPFLYWHNYDGSFTLRPWCIMSMYVGAIGLFVLLFQMFEYRNSRLKSELDEVKAINLLLEQRQEKIVEEEECLERNVLEDKEESGAEQEQMVRIEGQGIDATLVLAPRNIIYVESMSNYADICYIAENETKHKTLRITLKQIRTSLEKVDTIVQCHRAFLVNLDFVVSLSTRPQGYQLQLFGIEKQIPVSRANTETIKRKLA